MPIAVMDPGQMIRPKQVVAPVAPSAGSGIMSPGTPIRVDPKGTARQAARDRILRRQRVSDAELARQQMIEDAILARRQKIEDDKYLRQIQIDDAAYEDEKFLRDQEYKDERADDIARIKRGEDLADDITNRGRVLSDRDDLRGYKREVLEDERGYNNDQRDEKYRREDEVDLKDYNRGATDRDQQRAKHKLWVKESKARLRESRLTQEQIKSDALFKTKQLYAEFLNDVASNEETSGYRERLDAVIDSLSVEEKALQTYAMERTIGALNSAIEVYIDVGLDSDESEEWLENLFSQAGLQEVTEISTETIEELAFKVMSQVEADSSIALGIAPLTEVKTAIEVAARDQKLLVEQKKQFEIARSKVSNEAMDPKAIEYMKRAFRTKIGNLGEDAFEEVESKTKLDEDGKPRDIPSDNPTEDVGGNSIDKDPPLVTKGDTKAFLDDLGNENPTEEAIKDTEDIDESNSSATIAPAPEGASTFIEPNATEGESNSSAVINPGASSFIDENATDDDNMTEPDDFDPRSMTLNAVDLAGKGIDVLDRMANTQVDVVGPLTDAAEFVGENAEIIAPAVVAARKPLGKGIKKGYEGLENVIGKAGDAVANTAPVQALTAPDPSVGNIDDLVPDVDPNKPVAQRWKTPDGVDVTGQKGVSNARPVKVSNLMSEESVGRANQLLESKGFKPFTEPLPDADPNKKLDLKQRAEWQLRFRDHINQQVASGRTTLRTRLMNALKAMKPGMPQGKLGKFLKVLAPAATAYEVIALGKDIYELLSREDPEAAQAVKEQLEVEEAGIIAEESMAPITEEIQNSMGTSEEVSMPIEEMNNSADFSSGEAGTYNLPPNLAEALKMDNLENLEKKDSLSSNEMVDLIMGSQ